MPEQAFYDCFAYEKGVKGLKRTTFAAVGWSSVKKAVDRWLADLLVHVTLLSVGRCGL